MGIIANIRICCFFNPTLEGAKTNMHARKILKFLQESFLLLSSQLADLDRH